MIKLNQLIKAGWLFLVLISAIPTCIASENVFTVYASISGQFAKLVKKGKPLPQYSEERVRKLLKELGNHKRFLDSRKFTSSDSDDLWKMCGSAQDIALLYYTAGMSATAIKGVMTAGISTADESAIKINVVKYQDEITLLSSFSTRCLGKALPLVSEFVKRLKPEEFDSTRQQGLIRLRRGVLTAYLGMAEAYNTTSTSLRNRGLLIEAMADVSEVYAQVLDLSSREKVRQHLLSSQNMLPSEFSTHYNKIIKSMSSKVCKDLCLL